MEHGVHMLLVAWQDPESRRVFPVARLRRLRGGAYELVYVRAALEARTHGFSGLPGFPDFGPAYVSATLPALFEQRSVRRRTKLAEPADSARSSAEERFDPSPIVLAVPMEGGAQARLEVFAPPLPVAAGRYFGVFAIRGVGRVAGSEAASAGLEPRERLQLRAEPDNPYNRHALQVIRRDGGVIGYVPDYLASEMAAAGSGPEALLVELLRKERINFPPAPPRYHLACRYTCDARLGRSLFQSPAYAPLSASGEA